MQFNKLIIESLLWFYGDLNVFRGGRSLQEMLVNYHHEG